MHGSFDSLTKGINLISLASCVSDDNTMTNNNKQYKHFLYFSITHQTACTMKE